MIADVFHPFDRVLQQRNIFLYEFSDISHLEEGQQAERQRDQQNDQENAQERSCIVSAIDILAGYGKNDQQELADNGNGKQDRIANIPPRGNRTELIRTFITDFAQ